MSWTWKQCVADLILKMVNAQQSAMFSISDVYSFQDAIQQRFPQNRHVKEKTRQILQRLRNDGFLTFLGGGNYSLNFEFQELGMEPVVGDSDGFSIPETRRMVRNVRLRDTLLAIDIKRRYNFRCQVCRETVPLGRRDYAEGHHLKPLGSPHHGPDVEGNIIVVCPNHHVMVDRGALFVEPYSLQVRHVSNAIKPCRLFVQPWHTLKTSYIEYHSTHIFSECSS